MAKEVERTVNCAGCGRVLADETQASPEERQPCPSCGSTTRHVALSVHDEGTFHERVELKARHEGLRKPYLEARSGEAQQSDGSWKEVERIIDRDNDLYREKVVDPQSGDVHHFQEEPLSDHREHGSAKVRKASATETPTTRDDPAPEDERGGRSRTT